MAEYKITALEQIQYLASAMFSKWKSWSAMEWEVTLPASGWSDTAPYTQTVAVTGIKSTDNPWMFLDKTDSSYSGATAGEQTALEAEYLYVKQVETSDGSITATCTFDKPTSDIHIILKGH